ncbi:MAG: hypothetical protein EOP05_20620 [Proteobacteria bacterium]|nr:MAG: hypothetical protein EOP05_20620 [Pseudomonadota bacterium]
MEKIFNWLHRQSLRNRCIIIALITVALAVLDWDTGTDFNFSFFYLIPVSMTAWFVGINPGYFMCVFTGIVWGMLNLGDHEWHSTILPMLA